MKCIPCRSLYPRRHVLCRYLYPSRRCTIAFCSLSCTLCYTIVNCTLCDVLVKCAPGGAFPAVSCTIDDTLQVPKTTRYLSSAALKVTHSLSSDISLATCSRSLSVLYVRHCLSSAVPYSEHIPCR